MSRSAPSKASALTFKFPPELFTADDDDDDDDDDGGGGGGGDRVDIEPSKFSTRPIGRTTLEPSKTALFKFSKP